MYLYSCLCQAYALNSLARSCKYHSSSPPIQEPFMYKKTQLICQTKHANIQCLTRQNHSDYCINLTLVNLLTRSDLISFARGCLSMTCWRHKPRVLRLSTSYLHWWPKGVESMPLLANVFIISNPIFSCWHRALPTQNQFRKHGPPVLSQQNLTNQQLLTPVTTRLVALCPTYRLLT